jgi:TonB family protein
MPPESPDNPTNLPPPPREPIPFIPVGSRYSDLEAHELWQLLDDMEDERGKARRREAFYISTIIYMFLAWFAFYGPHVLWHQPHMINPADALKDRDMTYLDMPPDALKQLNPKPPKILSDKDRVAETPDRKTLQHLKAEEPPPAPTPQQAAEQAALPSAPAPQPPPPQTPQPDQSIVEAPKPQQQPARPNFNQPQQSAADTLKQLSENALPTRPGFHGTYGGEAVHHAGSLGNVDVLSDTTGVDPDDLQKYIRRLLIELRATWIPLLPEETEPPLTKQGDTLISFTIAPDGRVLAMHLDDSTHDTAINHAAWNAIQDTPYQPPPKGLKDPNLSLRIRFMVNEPEE